MTENQDIIIYSTGCPKCNVLKAKLSAKNIPFTENHDVDFMVAQGWTEVPMLQIGDKYYNFGEAIKWLQTQN